MNEKPIGCRCGAQDDPEWHSKECWIRQTDALRQQLAEAQTERNDLQVTIDAQCTQILLLQASDRAYAEASARQMTMIDHYSLVQQQLAEAEKTMSGAWESMGNMSKRVEDLKTELAEAQEWKRTILGTGTDQEAVIRLAASEYTKLAVQCWKDKVNGLEQGLAAAYLEVRHYREACASVGETDGHGWAQTTKELRQQLAQVIAERDAAETRNENYRLKLNASDSVIAQLSEHLAEDQAEIARLQEEL